MNRDGLLTRREVMRLMGISETTIKRWMREDKIRPASIRVINGKVRQYWFDRAYIESLLEEEKRSQS